MMVRVLPWAAKAPVIASKSVALRSVVASRDGVAGAQGAQERVEVCMRRKGEG